MLRSHSRPFFGLGLFAARKPRRRKPPRAALRNLEVLEQRTLLAQGWYVDSSFTGTSNGSAAQPYKTIFAAIGASGAGDTIFVGTGKGYHESDLIAASKANLTITSAPGQQTPVLDGAVPPTQKYGITGIAVDATGVTISGLTIQNFVGDISVEHGGSATITNDTITNINIIGVVNTTGINVGGGTALIQNDTITGNGTGVSVGVTCTATIFQSPIEASWQSAGIWNEGTANVTACTIANSSGINGGIYNSGTLSVTACTIANNSANRAYVEYAGDGGGIANIYGTATVTDCTLTGNSAAGNGGGIFNENAAGNHVAISVTGCTLSGNSTAGEGGGCFNSFSGTMTLTGCTIANNQAAIDGGGIGNVYGTATVTNSTLASNSAGSGGGLINNSTLTVVNSTIAGNSAGSGGSGGGLLDVGGGTATLDNTIVAQNTRLTGTSPTADDIASSGTGTVSSTSANNLIGTGGAGGLINGVNGNLVGIANPGLGALADNGGPTQTIALLPASPAINAGNNARAVDGQGNPLATDQRGPGFPRIVNGTVDIGAFESAGTLAGPILTSLSPPEAVVGSASLVLTVNGTNFVAGSVVQWNGTALTTTFVKSTQLNATVPASDLAGIGPAQISVTNPGAGGTSSSLTFQVLPVPVAVDVNAAWAGDSLGTSVTWTDGSTHSVGYDAFSTIGAAVSAVAAGGTVQVAAGTFHEAVLIQKALTLTGAGPGSGGTVLDGSQGPGSDGIRIEATSGVTISSLAIQNFGGAGIFNLTYGTTRVTNCTIDHNAGKFDLAGFGGGIDNFYGNITVADCTIAGNSGGISGGIYNSNLSGTMTVTNCTIAGNSAMEPSGSYGYGGGIENVGAMTVTNCTIAGNSVGIVGSGAGIYNSGTITVTNCTIAGNTVGGGGSGGGIDNNGTMTATNCTIAGNTVGGGSGGGIASGLINASTMTVTNCTIVGNSAGTPGVGGGLYANGATTLNNTIVALNTAGTSGDIEGSIFIPTSANNLIGTGGSGGLINGTNGNLVGVVNPGLASGLTDNGGPTQTLALLPGSPALDAGNNAFAVDSQGQPLTTDQRGLPRVVGAAVDIGAFESSGFTLAIAAGNNQATPVQTVFPTALRVTVTPQHAGDPVDGGWINFTAPASGPSATLSPSGSVAIVAGATAVTATANGIVGGPYALTATAAGAAPVSFSLSNAPPVITGSTATIWSSTAAPATPSAGDSRSVELGVKFDADVAGSITGIRFYKGSGNTGTHVGHLWTSTGTLLASATFTNETASGWQQVDFSAPVAITAGTTYIASYLAPNGHYAYDQGYFTSSGVDNGVLHALSNAAAGGNGVFLYGSGGFPTGSWGATNYWVDVAFSTSVVPAVAATTPIPGATGVSTTTPNITASFNEPVQSGTIAFVLVDSGDHSVPATVTYNSATNTATLIPTSALAASTTYTATIIGAQDAAGNAMTDPFSWSFTTAPAANTTVTIWSSTAAPATPSAGDSRSVELGVKFDADVAGSITGIRFYKGSGNTGTHVGYLWSSTGTLLASATFTNETAGGWQQVNFSTPVAIAAGTTYIASYLAPNGHYAYDQGYFASSGVDNGVLHALSNAAAGGNGVFLYGTGGFPTGTWGATNYWVDVVFNTTVTGSATGAEASRAAQPTGQSVATTVFPGAAHAAAARGISTTGSGADGNITTSLIGTIDSSGQEGALNVTVRSKTKRS